MKVTNTKVSSLKLSSCLTIDGSELLDLECFYIHRTRTLEQELDTSLSILISGLCSISSVIDALFSDVPACWVTLLRHQTLCVQHLFFAAWWHRFSRSVETVTVWQRVYFHNKWDRSLKTCKADKLWDQCLSNNTKGEIAFSSHKDLFYKFSGGHQDARGTWDFVR